MRLRGVFATADRVCYVGWVSEYLDVDHPRFTKVQKEIFIAQVVPDCMSHGCKMQATGTVKLDACCQYGVDVDLNERDGILQHREELAALLKEQTDGSPWFEAQEHQDADFPSGRYVRTRTHNGGCVFLRHSGRGCAIHRASLEGGWDFHGIKPHVCRLFPLSYDSESIVLSDDYADYSCAYSANSPSVYRVGRVDLEAVFGVDLVRALDRVETQVLNDLSPTKQQTEGHVAHLHVAHLHTVKM